MGEAAKQAVVEAPKTPTLTPEDTKEVQQAYADIDAWVNEAQKRQLAFEAARAWVKAAESRAEAAKFKLMAQKGISPDNYTILRKETGEIVIAPNAKSD